MCVYTYLEIYAHADTSKCIDTYMFNTYTHTHPLDATTLVLEWLKLKTTSLPSFDDAVAAWKLSYIASGSQIGPT